jgi:hypothetical protein
MERLWSRAVAAECQGVGSGGGMVARTLTQRGLEALDRGGDRLYGYYERLEPLLENVQRDAAVMPLVAEMNAYPARYLEEIRDLLLQAWPTRGGASATCGEPSVTRSSSAPGSRSSAAKGARPTRRFS